MNHEKLRGSQWKRWDLHIHTPDTKLSNCYSSDQGDVWDNYIEALENSDVAVFGITDYFSCENYFTLIKKYKARFPDSHKVFFPNIEFRLTEVVSKDNKNVHTHVIFDNDAKNCSKEQIEAFLGNLSTHKTNANGTKVSCKNLSSKAEIESATVSIENLKQALTDQFGNEEPYLIVTAANNEGLREVDTNSARKKSMSDELDRSSHAFFGSKNNNEWFLNTDRYEKATRFTCEAKPVFSGSDAHSFDDLERLSGDVTHFPACWIKAKPTFRGLFQTIYEPEARVFIGDQPPVLERKVSEATKIISHLKIRQVEGYTRNNGVWFNDIEIPINPELTVIIGNKGSGKSALADIIGLLGETRNEEHFSFLSNRSGNKKFRKPGYAENFEAELHWHGGGPDEKKLNDPVNLSNPEKVKYLPQNFFEHITNDLETNTLRSQIESMVFSHVEETERIQTNSFKELEELKTAQTKEDIRSLKTKLREINLQLINLENKANPTHLELLEKQLSQLQESYNGLDNSLKEIKEVNKPSEEDEKQKDINNHLQKWTNLAQTIEEKKQKAIANVAAYKAKHEKLVSLYKSLKSLDNYIKQSKIKLTPLCEELGFDIEKIVTAQIDFSEIIKQGQDLKTTYEAFEVGKQIQITDKTDLNTITTIPGLSAASEYIQTQIQLSKDQLTLPHWRYQAYLQKTQHIKKQLRNMQGNPEDPSHGSIEYFKAQKAYVNDKLRSEINNLKSQRLELSKEIFTAKNNVLNFYKKLQNSVETKLSDVSLMEFEVTIQASFVQKPDFSQRFFQFVNQQKKGPFRLEIEGKNKLREMVEDVDWNNFESISDCIEKILETMSSQDDWSLEKQVDQRKEFYDFLYELEYFEAKYELLLGGNNLDQLSPGEKGLLLLVFYLHLDKDNTPLVIDQPEDNLDNESIFQVLAHCIRSAKKTRQVILVTHNPNLAVGADAEQILYVNLDKADNHTFKYESGAIETESINKKVVQVLEGSHPAFVQRRLKYRIT